MIRKIPLHQPSADVKYDHKPQIKISLPVGLLQLTWHFVTSIYNVEVKCQTIKITGAILTSHERDK